jgi:hypothetical protein
MPSRRTEFTATTVECFEANDLEIVQVNFDALAAGFDEENRSLPCLLISANFEFSRQVQLEYHDGENYAVDSLDQIQLWRRRVLAFSGSGHEFDINFELSDDAFVALRHYLKVLLGSDCFHE